MRCYNEIRVLKNQIRYNDIQKEKFKIFGRIHMGSADRSGEMVFGLYFIDETVG